MARDLYFHLVVFITLLIDLASSLYLSQESALKNVGDTFIVICKDKERGLPVSWRGPKDTRLGKKTHPKVQTSSFGTAIMFNHARQEDSGNYTCSTNSKIPELNIFRLKVEAEMSLPTTTDTELLTDKPIIDNEETNVPPPVTRETFKHTIYYPTEADPEVVFTIPSTTEEVVVKTASEEDTDVPPTTVKTYTHRVHKTTEERRFKPEKEKHKNRHKNGKQHSSNDLIFKDSPEVQVLTEEEQNGFLKCEVNKADATINWLFANKTAVTSANNSPDKDSKYAVVKDGLVIRNVNRQDSRVYLCEAVHGSSGLVKYQTITAIVEHKPNVMAVVPTDVTEDTDGDPEDQDVPPVYAKEKVVYGFLNEMVNLTCEVEAVPSPKFTWSVKDKDTDVSDYVVDISSHKSLLQVLVTEEHETPITYKCVASNKLGEDDVYFTVQLALHPDEPSNVTLVEATSNSLRFEITIPEPSDELISYGMEPQFLVVKYREQSLENEWLWQKVNITNALSVKVSLTDLKKKTLYEIQIATKNVAGLSDYSNILATTSTAPRSVQATMLILILSVCLSILLPTEMQRA